MPERAIPGDVTCDEVPVRIVDCIIPVLEAGTSQTIKIVLVAPPTLGTITNTVTVDPSNSIFESDETNNIAVESDHGRDRHRPDDPQGRFAPGFAQRLRSDRDERHADVPHRRRQHRHAERHGHPCPRHPAGRDTVPDGRGDRHQRRGLPGLHGFTCTHDGSATGGVVDCVGGSLLGTADEFYFPPQPGDDKAYIEIKVFARPTVGIMHNEVRVDPLNQIAEYDETDNIEFEDTNVITGNAGVGAFNELTILKTQTSPGRRIVATNGVVTYDLQGRQPRHRPGQRHRGQGHPASRHRASSRPRTRTSDPACPTHSSARTMVPRSEASSPAPTVT